MKTRPPKSMGMSRRMPGAPDVIAFVRRAIALAFEMRFEWETKGWPVHVQEVAETLSGYYDSMRDCLEQLREGQALRSGLAYYRVRGPVDRP
jgi:hypothetical protein